MDTFLTKKGQVCLGIITQWPVDLEPAERRTQSGRTLEMATLEKIGLVRSQEAEVERIQPFEMHPAKIKVLRYELTDEGRKFFKQKDILTFSPQKGPSGDLCYGQQSLDRIVKWQGPLAFGDYKQVSVFYTYKIQNLASWAKDADLQKTFPGIAPTIEGQGKKVLDHTLTLTNQGWESTGLDN